MIRAVFIISILLSTYSYGDCSVEHSQIKSSVESYFAEIENKYPIFITESEFKSVSVNIKALVDTSLVCFKLIRDEELATLDYPRWGEVSDIYLWHHQELKSIDIQLDTAIESYDPIWKRIFIDKWMWKKVLNDYLQKEI